MLRRFAFHVTLVTALTGALSSPGHAQTGAAVRGTVHDADEKPLSGVVVAIPGLGLSVATVANGRYVLPRVPAGRYVLQFHRLGYAPHEVTVDLTADTTVTADVTLEPQSIELGSVLVEGVSRAPDRVMDAPAAVEVVRPTTAAAVSINGQAPLALARVPGLDVAQGAVGDFNVNARGFNTMLARKLLVLQDGRDLGTALGGSQIWGALSEPLADLARIEVIRGPGSALYGANAFNGVINITTPPARDVAGTKVTVGGGELGTARADFRHAGLWNHDRFGYRVNFGYTRSDDWTRSRTNKDSSDWRREYAAATSTPPPKTVPDNLPLIGQTKDPATGQALGTPDPLVAVYGSARLDYYAATRSVVTLEGGTARLNNAVFLSGTGRNEATRAERPWARLAWDADGSGVSAWYSGLSLPIVSLTSGKPLFDYESVFHLEGRTSHRLNGDAGRVVVGASIQDNRVDSKETALGPVSDDRRDQYYGAFGQLEYGVGRVRLIGAVRWDDSRLFPMQLSPKTALIVSVARSHTLRLTVDRAFLTPSLPSIVGGRFTRAPWDLTAVEATLRADPSVGPALTAVPESTLFTKSAAVPESAFGNPHLVPQTATSYELGYRGQFGQRVFITLDAYDAHVRNFLTGLLPAGTTRLNRDYQPWNAPNSVPVGSRAAVDSAVQTALAAFDTSKVAANGLTRLRDGTTAIVLSFGNVGTVDEWGVELGTSVSLSRALTLSASYTWYNFTIRQNLASNVLSPNTPQNKGTAALEYAGREGVDFGMDVRIVGGYHWSSGNWVGDVPPSQTVNVSAGYRVNPNVRVFANTTNLFDQRRFQVYGGAVIGRRVLVGVTSTF